jgi:hypothetical protein
VQLEYSSPSGVADSVTAFALLERVWAAFGPYVERAGLEHAILTETVLDTLNVQSLKLSKNAHYGIVLSHDIDGLWRVKASGHALAPVKASETLWLTDPNGNPMSLGDFAQMMKSLADSMSSRGAAAP